MPFLKLRNLVRLVTPIIAFLLLSISANATVTLTYFPSMPELPDGSVMISPDSDGEIFFRKDVSALILDVSSKRYSSADAIVVHVKPDSIIIPGNGFVEITDIPPGNLRISVKALKGVNGMATELSSGSFSVKMVKRKPLIKDDKITLGILMLCLALVFWTSTAKNRFWQRFYRVIPALLMCYMLPAILNSVGMISSEISGTYHMATRYLLPASLILMTLSIDLKGIRNLGGKMILMFLTGTVGIIIGGPIAILLMSFISPETVGGIGFDAAWRGLATLAGSWIGGGANQGAMLEVYKYNPQKYGAMILVDIVVANIWMAFLLLGVGKSNAIDRWLKADSSAITNLKNKVESYTLSIQRNASLADLILIAGIGIAGTSLSHFGSKYIVILFTDILGFSGASVVASDFLWLVVLATTIGLVISFTPMRKLEGAGASKVGSVFIYILVATIGMKMDVTQIFDDLWLVVLGLVWMAIHVGLLLIVAKLIRAPYFFLAVGSKANVGGAASAPVVAAAFHPALAPVGVLLAVLGYALGTYGAIICAQLMEIASKIP